MTKARKRGAPSVRRKVVYSAVDPLFMDALGKLYERLGRMVELQERICSLLEGRGKT